MFPMMVGAENKALLMSLEHRYYGESQPFKDWKTENLRWLTAWEALADIASFIEAQNKVLGRKAEWVIVGGSYPGALAAWFKSLYPDHAVAAWSSSGVINAIEDFHEFDRDLYDRANESRNGCHSHVRDVIEHIESEFESTEGIKRVLKAFGLGAGELNVLDFHFFFADIITTGIQYGNRVKMCDELDDNSGSVEQVMATIAKFGADAGVTYNDYWRVALQSTDIPKNNAKAGRQWTYEYCTQFGWFQTPNRFYPMRSVALDMDFWYEYCKDIFGEFTQEPAVREINRFYKGLDITGDNIFFLNGSEDPWQFAGMTSLKHPHSSQRNMRAEWIECDTCGHCVDFQSPHDGQAKALT